MSSRGLKHVQTIRLGDCQFARYANNRFIPKILKGFQPDTLLDIEYGNCGRPTPGQLASLLEHQTKVRSLDIEVATWEGRDETDGIAQRKMAIAKELLRQANSALLSRSCIQKLVLTVEGTKDQTLCHELLSTGIQTAQLQELTLKTPLIFDWDDDLALVPLDYRFFLGCIRTSPTLVHISLSFFLLPAETILFDSCPSLKKLTILGCGNIGPVLDAFQGPRLTSLIIRDMTDVNGGSKQPFEEIASLLRRFSSLQTLILESTWVLGHEDVRNTAMALPCHAQSLQSLIFGCRPTKGVINHKRIQNITDQVVTAAIRRCTRLEEIALSMEMRNFVDQGSVSQQLQSWFFFGHVTLTFGCS